MKKFLTIICIAGLVLAIAGCNETGVYDEGVGVETDVVTVGVSEDEEMPIDESDVPLCECDKCGEFSLDRQFQIETYLHGQEITIPVFGVFAANTTSKIHERMYLAERAVEFFINLDKDYDEAIKQVKFGPSEYSNNEYLSRRFNNNSNLNSIYSVYILDEVLENRPLRISVSTKFDDSEYESRICVEFWFENGEWTVNNVFDITHGF